MIGSGGNQFGELVQALKLSYNKATAVKLWTDIKSMRTQLLDFYGVKMINNTRGTGEILGSRMLKIQTRRIPAGFKQEFDDLLPAESAKLGRLRDELHSWTFSNVRRIETEYKSLYPKPPDRSDEITASLKVMAALAGDQELHSQLEIALTRQNQQATKTDNPRELLHEALSNLIAQGYDTISPTHLVLELRRLISQNSSLPTDDMPEWVNPGWVGRMLRTLKVLEAAPENFKRIRVYGTNLRFYLIGASYLDEVRERFSRRNTEISIGIKQPTEFCGECESCPYSSLNCAIMFKRLETRKPQPTLL